MVSCTSWLVGPFPQSKNASEGVWPSGMGPWAHAVTMGVGAMDPWVMHYTEPILKCEIAYGRVHSAALKLK